MSSGLEQVKRENVADLVASIPRDAPDARPFVCCERIVKAYRVAGHELVALRGIDFRMGRGEMVAIVGPSGAGKSSLLNLLGGLDRPTAGALRVDEQDLLALKPRQLARYRLARVGFLWQNVGQNLLGHRTALHNVTLPMMLLGIPPRERRKRARALLEEVGLGDQINKRPSAMSGGQQQRVALAVALANRPPLLLMDEPTGALDRKSAEQVMELIEALRREFHLTVLMVTHDMQMAAFADRVLTLRDGALGQDLSGADAGGQYLDDEGRLILPDEVRQSLRGSDRLSIEIRPEGILVRGESDDDEDADALLQNVLPQDEPPRERGLLGRWVARLRGKQ